ncbi:MAG: prepilin-type N-terminal cleavage/methylation domain-containing protein, partial [Ruminococcus sp.]
MKTKKKGFSLVELICTLTIAAIIAVAAAPNVSAYILNSKIQNYQTALNNLVDELQTQLPQTRYWNWQEVQDNAAEILGSDITRNISEPEIDGTKYTYTLSNVSTDSDVQFKLSIDYGTPSLTKQDITISGECVGYDAVKSENNTCTVLLKSNFVDKDNYPKLISTINVPLDSSGWKPMKNMGGTYSYWEPYNLSNKDNDFAPTGEIPDKNSDAFYLNLTDYPAGACEQIIFTMQRYQVKVDSSLTEIGYVDDSGNWVATYGYNEGDKYTIIKRCYYVNCKGEEKNLDPW